MVGVRLARAATRDATYRYPSIDSIPPAPSRRSHASLATGAGLRGGGTEAGSRRSSMAWPPARATIGTLSPQSRSAWSVVTQARFAISSST